MSTDAGVVPNHQQIKAAWDRRDEPTQESVEWQFMTLASPDRPIGLLAVRGKLGEEQTDLVRNLCEQAALALDRTRLAGDLEEARLVSETEQLRSALLSSVSHDLRTPLASIIGSSTSLLEYGKSFSEENRQELLATIAEEARRLDRHIQNLLDMTRLGHRRLTLSRDWVDLHDVVAGALDRLKEMIKTVSVEIAIETSIPLMWIHGAFLEQALVNILDNAILFTEPGGIIRVSARLVSETVVIEIQDEGPGIPEAYREKVFDMFYTLRQGDRMQTQGTGLGLAICRGMVGAHGGSVNALEGSNGIGTCMQIVLPLTLPAKAVSV
jgi:two-component system sensor histidine kinase KdpD